MEMCEHKSRCLLYVFVGLLNTPQGLILLCNYRLGGFARRWQTNCYLCYLHDFVVTMLFVFRIFRMCERTLREQGRWLLSEAIAAATFPANPGDDGNIRIAARC